MHRLASNNSPSEMLVLQVQIVKNIKFSGLSVLSHMLCVFYTRLFKIYLKKCQRYFLQYENY